MLPHEILWHSIFVRAFGQFDLPYWLWVVGVARRLPRLRVVSARCHPRVGSLAVALNDWLRVDSADLRRVGDARRVWRLSGYDVREWPARRLVAGQTKYAVRPARDGLIAFRALP